MGIMNLFRKAEPAKQHANPADYVEWLLVHMLRTSRTELTVDTRQPLPGSDPTKVKDDPPPCMPDAQTVINRLKILSGVNPIWQEGLKTTGTFERPRTHHTVTVTTQFKDDINKSICIINLKIFCIKS